MTLENHARLIREHLDDPRELCDRLGLLSGRPGREWMRQAKGLLVLCPWHDERTASCSVTRGRDGTIQVCCQACGETGDALHFIAAAYRLDIRGDFREVLREAASLAGLHIDLDTPTDWQPRLPPRRPPPPPEPPPLEDDVFDAIGRIVLASCSLRSDPAVREYLIARRLARLTWEAGWAALPADPGKLQELRARIVEAVGDEAWMASGLAVRSGRRRGEWVWSGHRLVIPWRTPDGHVYTLQRRVLGDPPEGVGKYVFASGRSPRWPFGVERKDTDPSAPVVFVEGAVDTLALRALCESRGFGARVLGLPGVGAWRGVHGPSWAQVAQGRVAVVALDVDAKGQAKVNVQRAAEQMKADLGAAGAVRVDVWRPKAPSKDWGDAWRADPLPMKARAS